MLPPSGQLSLADISTEIYGYVDTDISLVTMGALAGMSSPYSIDEFHGYSQS